MLIEVGATDTTHGFAMVQGLPSKPAYRTSELYELAGSKATAHRLIDRLVELGFAERLVRGYLLIRSSARQPQSLWPHLVPSLRSYREARRYGRAYDESDVKYAMTRVRGIVTLDYRAFELTRLQTPWTYCVYADDAGSVAERLKESGFSEGRAGRLVVMPKFGAFDNEVQRVYLDCLAVGGRSLLDAIAIELMHGEELTVKGAFDVDQVVKVMEGLPGGS